jgi:hypothetical protein
MSQTQYSFAVGPETATMDRPMLHRAVAEYKTAGLSAVRLPFVIL